MTIAAHLGDSSFTTQSTVLITDTTYTDDSGYESVTIAEFDATTPVVIATDDEIRVDLTALDEALTVNGWRRTAAPVWQEGHNVWTAAVELSG